MRLAELKPFSSVEYGVCVTESLQVMRLCVHIYAKRSKPRFPLTRKVRFAAMKKSMTTLTAAGVIATLALAGCSSGRDGAEPKNAPSEQDKTQTAAEESADPDAPQMWYATIDKAVDGDTVLVTPTQKPASKNEPATVDPPSKGQITVNLLGIKAPQKGDCGFQALNDDYYGQGAIDWIKKFYERAEPSIDAITYDPKVEAVDSDGEVTAYVGALNGSLADHSYAYGWHAEGAPEPEKYQDFVGMTDPAYADCLDK